jgi:hypothetical protein
MGARSIRRHAVRHIVAGVTLLLINVESVGAQGGPFIPSARPRIRDATSCPDRSGSIFADGGGRVVGFLDRAEALSMRLRTEMMLRGKSDPTLVDNPRAIVEVMRPQGASREIAVVPDGVTVAVGEAVEFDGGYWAPENACMFIPNLVRKTPATG